MSTPNSPSFPIRNPADTQLPVPLSTRRDGALQGSGPLEVGDGDAHPRDLPLGDAHLGIERTFCVIDLSGFTSYMLEHGAEEASQRLTEFRRATRDVAAKRGVRIAKWLGDGVMLVSVGRSAALAAGAHLTAHFADSGIPARAGGATGTAMLFEGDDYIGVPLNLAFRLCDAAKPGEMLACADPEWLPAWVDIHEQVTMDVRSIGWFDNIVRLRPRLALQEVDGHWSPSAKELVIP